MRLRSYLLLAGLALITLAGCVSRAPAPTTVALSISGGADMNGGTPAQVKVYYLRDTNTFTNSDFFALFEAPEETLGEDLIAVEGFGLIPGRVLTDAQSFTAPPAAIGVVAAFRDIGGTFLATHALKPNAANQVDIILTGNRVLIP